jgi:NADPH-dependent 2,4-dienoyl-CoA reductase/sulfur reductase-like enzyme
VRGRHRPHGRGFWDDRLDDAARQALQPGPSDDLNRSPDVLVVGGGAVGLAVAAACRRAGVGQVVTIEQAARLARGARFRPSTG